MRPAAGGAAPMVRRLRLPWSIGMRETEERTFLRAAAHPAFKQEYKMTPSLMRLFAVGLIMSGVLTAIVVSADEPQAEEPAVSTQWGRAMPVQQAIYHSNALQADFIAQWMFINPAGRRIEFWGARLVGMAPDSPLTQTDVQPGDVITRLDGIPISRGMYRSQAGWAIPELERHFGGTEVRHIHQGTQHVHVEMMNINLYPSSDGDVGVAP